MSKKNELWNLKNYLVLWSSGAQYTFPFYFDDFVTSCSNKHDMSSPMETLLSLVEISPANDSEFVKFTFYN